MHKMKTYSWPAGFSVSLFLLVSSEVFRYRLLLKYST